MSTSLVGRNARLSAENTEKLVLYSTDLSPCVRRVRITLHEKRLPFDTVDVDLANMQQRSPEYLAINPNGFVPTLSHRGHIVFESGVINEYLEEQFPDTPLMPKDAYERAQVRMWMAAEGAMAKSFRAVMYQRLMGPLHHISRTHEEAQSIAARATHDPQDLAWESRVWHLAVLTPEEESDHEARLFAWLDNVERALKGRDYLVGDFFSQADISMYPRIAMYDYLGSSPDPGRYPNVTRWMALLERRPSFGASMTAPARKLRRLATSPFMTSVRGTLAKPVDDRRALERMKLRIAGKVLRRIMGVPALLDDTVKVTPLYMPGDADAALVPEPVDTRAGALQQGGRPGLILHGDEQSPYTWRLESLLNALGLAYTPKIVNHRAGEFLPEHLLAFNPQQDLPVLVCGDHVINGADTIADFLTSTRSLDGMWIPANSHEAARSRMWLALEAGSHKEFTPLWLRHVCGEESVYFIAGEEFALNRIRQPLGILECALRDEDYLCADTPGYADLAWASRLDVMVQVSGFCIGDFPALAAWHGRMHSLRASLRCGVGSDNSAPVQSTQ